MDIASLDISAILPLFLLLGALGCLAGFLAGLLGIGGGTVLVPGFFYIFSALGYDSPYLMHMAVGTALAVIIATGSSSSYAHYKRGSVDFSALKILAPALILGVVLGTGVANYLSGVQLQIIFAAILFLISIKMFRGKKASVQKDKVFRPSPLIFIAGTLSGLVSTVMGIGGSVFNIPIMVSSGVSMHRAVGASAALGMVVAIPGTIGFMLIGSGAVAEILPPFSIGFVNVLGWLAVIPFTVFCAPLGVAAAHRLNADLLRRIFAIFMMILAVNMAIEIWL